MGLWAPHATSQKYCGHFYLLAALMVQKPEPEAGTAPHSVGTWAGTEDEAGTGETSHL